VNTKNAFRSRITLILLIGIMALSLIPMAVFAESNYAAAIGNTQFSTLEEAFTYAQSQGGNVRIDLLTDATVAVADLFSEYNGITLTGGNITLDLNGHTVDGINSAGSSTDKSSVFFVSGNSNLTITDSVGGGRIEKTCNNMPAITVGGNAALTIESGEIESNVGAGICVKGGILTVEDGKIKGYNAGIHMTGGTLKVTGNAEIYGKYSNALLIGSGTAQLSGGIYKTDEGDLHSIWNSGGSAADLLVEGYRYGDGNGNAAAFSSDAETHGVKIEKGGRTVVEPLPPEGTPYIGADGELTYCTDYEELTGTYANIRGNGWYVLTESMTKNYAFSIFGSANLIICDGATLTLDTLKGSTFGGDSSLVLNIYLQGGGTGKLIVKNGLVKANGESKTVTINLISPGMKMVDKDGNKTDGVGKYFEVSLCTDHSWTYTNQTDATHDRVCTLCGTTETGIDHTLKSWQSKDNDDRFHYKVCECGQFYEKDRHIFQNNVPNPDGLTCTPVCSTCEYKLEPQDHDFIDITTPDGDKIKACRNCYAELAAEYNGKQYASLQAAINALSEMSDSEKYGTAKTGTITIVAPEHINENVVVDDPDMVLTIDLGGKEWRADISGSGPYVPLTVKKGWVILKNGKLWQGSSSSSAFSGIVVTGGSLRLEGSVSVRGGTWDTNVSRPSVDLQGGRLELAAGVTLLTGIKVPEDMTLDDFLPKGTAFVKCRMDPANKSVTIPEPYEYITDIYDAHESTAGIAIVAHDHVADEHGKCTECEKQAYFAILTKADGTTEKISSFKDGWAAAIANEGSTLTLICDVDLGSGDVALEAESGRFTLDLAGYALKSYSREVLIKVSGTADITIRNGKLTNTVYGTPGDGQLYQTNACAINMYGGRVTLEHVELTGGSGNYDWKQCFSVTVYDGELKVTDCTFTGTVAVYKRDTTVNPTVKFTSAVLHHGIVYICVSAGDKNYYEAVKAFFADGSVFLDKDGGYIDITAAEFWQFASSEEYTMAMFSYEAEATVHMHITDEYGKCTGCRKQIYVAMLTKADGTTEGFSSFMDGWAAAIANEGSTLKLLCDVDLGSAVLDARSGKFTLDLGGFSLKGNAKYELILVSNTTADIIIKNGKLINTASVTSETLNFALAIYIRAGKVTLDNVDLAGGYTGPDGKQQSYSIYIDGGELDIVDSSFTGAIYVYKATLESTVRLKITSATLNNGIIYRGAIELNGKYEKYWEIMEAFFADGSVLLDPNGKYVDYTADKFWQVTNNAGSGEAVFTYTEKLIVKKHSHTTDGHGKCTICDMQVYVAVLTKADGTIEKFSSLEEGLTAAAANEGSTLTLLCDVDLRGEIYLTVSSGKFTLELAGFSITGKAQYGVIWVNGTADITIKNGKLINICKEVTQQDNGCAIVIYGGKLTLDGVDVTGSYGDVQCYSVEISGGGKLTVLSGSFTGAIYLSIVDNNASDLKIISATLHDGIRFEYISIFSAINMDKVYEIVKAFFADGSAFLDPDGKYIDITAAEFWPKLAEKHVIFCYEKEAVVKPHTHTVGEWTVDKAPSIFREGLRHGTCPDCGAPVSEVIPALGFDTVRVGHNCSFGNDLSRALTAAPTSALS